MNILFPGRHLVNTAFQEAYLKSIAGLAANSQSLVYVGEKPKTSEQLDRIIVPITSANLHTSPYSPIRNSVRARAVDRLGQSIQLATGVPTLIYEIPHFPNNPKFVEYLLDEIHFQTDGDIDIKPENTVAVSSTNTMIEMFRKQGFSVLAAEQDKPGALKPDEVLEKIIASDDWTKYREIRELLHAGSLGIMRAQPEIVQQAKNLRLDPFLTESGDLTESRDYNTYAMGMSNPAILEVKYRDVKPFVKEGLIVDEGCADGSLLSRISQDFRDSRYAGVEITGNFIERCEALRSQGGFGSSYVYFKQANILSDLFEPNSVDTTVCNSTTHELWSYGNQKNTLTRYLKQKFEQTRPSGRIIIRDVVGPTDSQKEVYMKLTRDDGELAENIDASELGQRTKKVLESLSTFERFKLFATDYLPHDVAYTLEENNGDTFIRTSLKNAHEFMTKFMYTDNYKSEMHEEFAFWDIQAWKDALQDTGFTVIHADSYKSEYIETHYWKNIKLFEKKDNQLQQISNPVTNMVIVGEKKRAN